MKTMIKIKQILYAVMLSILLFGCAKDPFIDHLDDVPDGMVRLSVDLHTPSGSVVTTRGTAASATEQDLSGNVVVMVFDSSDPKTGKLKQQPVSGTVKGGNTLTALLKAEATESYICVVANIPTADKNYLLGLTAGATLSDITGRLELTVTAEGLKSPLPMSGWSEKIDKITKGSSTAISISLLRSVARIDVDGSVANFSVHGVQLVNGAKKGYVLPQETLPYFGETDVIGYTMSALETPAMTFTEKLYCFENAGMHGNTPNPTRVVIKGQRQGASSPSYYAIEIAYKAASTTKDLYDIERNKIYTIRLNKVDKDGYISYEEAAKSEAFNNQIESDIVVTDPYAYNIVTNGKQYMGVTNSEFVLYPISATDTPADLLVATLSYTCDSEWSEGTITAPQGITLVADKLEVQHGSAPLYRDIIVKNIAPGFTEGVIVAHVGNLRQEIKVTVKAPTLPAGQIINDYFAAPNDAKDYKVGEIIAPTNETAWLKVSSSSQDEGGSSLNDKITHPEGGIYVHVQPNIGFNESAKPREASLFVAGSKENQRVRIYVQQGYFDVYSQKKQIEPFTYVGTFHRWNQTAERLIRIDASKNMSGGNVWWQATVVAGREFIILSTANSLDPKVDESSWRGAGGAMYTTDADIEANCQVEGALRTVSGNTSYVYFRVGLTGRLSGPAAAPRYGLIALTYGSGNTTYGTHNIYVRQGEAADYLMRPWDASTTPINPETGANSRPIEFASSSRPKAVKFGVYNLTVPNPDPSKDTEDLGPRSYNFVQYPTQGGYYFLASGTQAIKPTVANWITSLTSPPAFNTSDSWKREWETCPKGYRRPDDGEARGASANRGNPGLYPRDIQNSEVRQSLWLFPLHGVARSDFSNQLRGYLADGFFDRREINGFASNVNLPDMQYGIVEETTVNAGYWGFLVFNPHNYASIFAPLNGSYRHTYPTGGASLQGQDGSFHTRTPGTTDDDGWLVAFGYFTTTELPGYVFDSYEKSTAKTGYSIRCVKDEQPAVGTDNPQVEKPTDGGGATVINVSYASGTLKDLIEGKYTVDQIKQINTIAVNAQKTLEPGDYDYLNTWTNKTDHQLRHVVVRGAGGASIPVNAFTSARWSTISLVDANQIVSGAFTSNLTGLRQLSLPYLDAITVDAGAFGFTTSDVQLFLNGYEYAAKQGNNWNSCTWKGIKKY